MEATLETFLTTGVFAFMLTFVRVGTAFMIMPGVGDSFVPERVRLFMALAMTLVFLPLTTQYLPAQVPATFPLILLISFEFIVGLFMGTVARIFMTATDTAGMVISTMSGLGSAQILNPALSSQGSLLGAFLSVTAAVVLFALDLHHLLISAILDSYNLFPVNAALDMGSMAEFISKTVSASFAVGVKMAAPFIVLTLLVYVGMGVLSRVMPQVQVFIISLPLQIIVSLLLLSLCLFAIFGYWATQFEQVFVYLLSGS